MTVYLTSSSGHYEGIANILNLMKNTLVDLFRSKKRIVIKPNFVSTVVELAATHVKAVEATIDFIYSQIGSRKIIIAEGPATSLLSNGLKNFNYYSLKDKYDVEFVDLNLDDYKEIYVYAHNLEKKLRIRVAKTILDADFRISICRPKTHDTVVATLSIKNIAVGSLIDHDKSKIHAGFAAINLSIAEIATKVMPHLSIIDGYVGMEGNGPVSGDPKPWGIAVAGTNPVEVDAFTAWLMGFNPQDIGYLYILHKWGYGEINPEKIEVVGENPLKYKTKFKPHWRYEKQLTWKNELARKGDLLERRILESLDR